MLNCEFGGLVISTMFSDGMGQPNQPGGRSLSGPLLNAAA